VASRRRKPNPSASSGVSATPATVAGHFLPALEEFVIHGDGQISIGTIKPIACAAIANDGHNMLADIGGGEMTLITLKDMKRLMAPTPAPQRTAAFTRYSTRADGTDVTVTVFERVCRDTMIGMPHPNAIEVLLDGGKLTGCGGDPASLLQGREWAVEEINGAGRVDGSRATLNFGDNGRVSGRASCNAYTGAYSLSGEELTISNTAGVRAPAHASEDSVSRRAARRAPVRLSAGRCALALD
jgi:hypothetical protein